MSKDSPFSSIDDALNDIRNVEVAVEAVREAFEAMPPEVGLTLELP